MPVRLYLSSQRINALFSRRGVLAPFQRINGINITAIALELGLICKAPPSPTT